MDNITEIEKEFITTLLRYQKNKISLSIKEILEEYILIYVNNDEIKLKITADKLYINAKKGKKKKILEITLIVLNLLIKLINDNYIYIYDGEEKEVLIGKGLETWQLEVRHNLEKKFLQSLTSNFLLSGKLKEFENFHYKTSQQVESQKNMKIAAYSILFGVVINGLIYLGEIKKNTKEIFEYMKNFIEWYYDKIWIQIINIIILLIILIISVNRDKKLKIKIRLGFQNLKLKFEYLQNKFSQKNNEDNFI